MWQRNLLQLYALICLPKLSDALQPAADARNYFATNFYRQLVYQSQLLSSDFVISPAAVQKLLTVIYSGVETHLADEMLWDLQLKHIDEHLLYADMRRAGLDDIAFAVALRNLQVASRAAIIDRESVMRYFAPDFAELADGAIEVQNYVILPQKLKLKLNANYSAFARVYFNVTLRPPSTRVSRIFNISTAPADRPRKSIELLSTLSHSSNWLRRQLNDFGVYRYAEFAYDRLDTVARMQVLELPLLLQQRDQLKLLLFLHAQRKHFEHFLLQILGRELSNFQLIQQQLRYNLVQLTAPRIKIKTKINLSNYFVELARAGLLTLFTENITMPQVFMGNAKTKFKFNSFWQQCAIDVSSSNDSVDEKNVTLSAVFRVFNATGKSCFFVIKSEQTLYFMGHMHN